MPDMDAIDIEKMVELLAGARESGRARRERMQGVPVDAARLAEVPSLVIGAGRDEWIHPAQTRRTADLIGAAYEYFPSASHFGLVMGEHSWPDVAQLVLGWLEERRHALAAGGTATVGARR
jgi:pimeloyl-ACP methyl ester carboxylesterase